MTSSQTLVGQAIDRTDGPLKVTGQAPYAYEYGEETVGGVKPAYGYLLGASIAKGRILSIDTAAAERAAGVLHIMTHRNAPAQPEFGSAQFDDLRVPFNRARPILANDRVRYYDEPVALVIAETFETARGAAALIEVRYAPETGAFDLKAGLAEAYMPAMTNAGFATDSERGDFEGAFGTAPIQIDATYSTPCANHNPMEPHAALAVWSGEDLTLYTSTQTIATIRTALASTLQVPLERVRVISRYVGGGFGNKLLIHADVVAAALAARELKRPVKVALTRQQMFSNTGHRPMMLQQVRLGATADGRLLAIGHEVWSQTARYEEFTEQTAAFTRSFYAAPNRRTRHRLVRLDTHRGEWMRAPGEAPGLLAFECAMDELAEKTGLDPIELRVRNEPEMDPERDVPFSSRNLVACMREGARRFGWDKRPVRPSTLRSGRTLIGYGMAAAVRPNYLRAAKALVRLEEGGRVEARLDMTDIGTGTYTILAQIVADNLGAPLSDVSIALGDSLFPVTPGSGGSFGAASSGSAVLNACLALRRQIAQAVASDGSRLRAVEAESAVFSNGEVRIGDRSEKLSSLATRLGLEQLTAEGEIAPGETYKTFSQHAFGAQFAEVGVDIDTGEIRLRRMLGVFAAGKILNTKTARSQMIGGMIWGMSGALLEESVLDQRYGHFVNHDLAEYHVPVNADVPELDVVFLDEEDDKGNPLGIKGIGELGTCGSGAAVANAVYNATGVRVREFPITLDKLLSALPSIAI